MKKLIDWMRRHAAVLIATSALVGVVAPELREVTTVVTAAAKSLSEPANLEPTGSQQP